MDTVNSANQKPKETRLYLSIFLFLSFLLFLIPKVYGDAKEIEEINDHIKNKGAHWIAGETEFSKLSHEEKKKRVGTHKPHPSAIDGPVLTESDLPPAVTTAPPSLDWRSYNGSLSVTPVRDQGSCGSCWAFAVTAALESQVLIARNLSGTNLDLSEQVLVSCSAAGSCSGGYISTASNYAHNIGLPVETCFPYTATNNTCSTMCSSNQKTPYKISGWHYAVTTTPTVDALKNALVTYGPLVTTMSVYYDFFNYHSGIYSYVSGAYQGGHAILLVGYSDSGQYFIAKNSWGTGWGEAGYFKIAFSQLTNVVEFGYWTIALEGFQSGPPPVPHGLRLQAG
jgi:C1A family cysteine protease